MTYLMFLARDTEPTAQDSIFSPSSSPAMNFTRSSIWLHSCQGILLSSQKALLCNPCLRNELSPFSQEGHLSVPAISGQISLLALWRYPASTGSVRRSNRE